MIQIRDLFERHDPVETLRRMKRRTDLAPPHPNPLPQGAREIKNLIAIEEDEKEIRQDLHDLHDILPFLMKGKKR
jgi:hypothetical protein